MEPGTALNAPCPCGSRRKYKKCCGADRLAPRSAAELAAWAAERGVVDQLRTTADAILAHQDGLTCEVPPWARSRMTVADLIAPGELLHFMNTGPMRVLREEAWAFLQEEAESVDVAIAAEAQPRLQPDDSTLRTLAARLLELRAELRAQAAPRSLDRIGPHAIRVDAGQRALTFREERKVSDSSCWRTREPLRSPSGSGPWTARASPSNGSARRPASSGRRSHETCGSRSGTGMTGSGSRARWMSTASASRWRCSSTRSASAAASSGWMARRGSPSPVSWPSGSRPWLTSPTPARRMSRSARPRSPRSTTSSGTGQRSRHAVPSRRSSHGCVPARARQPPSPPPLWPPCATTRWTASTGWPASRRGALALASPTTWDWARRYRRSRSCASGRAKGRRWSSLRHPSAPTG